MLIRYQAEDKASAEGLKTPTRGVSGLLQGDKTQLLPEGTERMARRQLNMVDPGYEAGCDGDSLEPMNGCGTGHKATV
jgi:lysine 2,3-aminomutase